ncbi:hypothetical protein ACQ5SO_09230 [Rhodovulum sp. DZ06]|uniref:hypothetical protein n=1 Tax=Rhodovulum sp. DZ06 TaxID=3425126 RepID=UPI003D328107
MTYAAAPAETAAATPGRGVARLVSTMLLAGAAATIAFDLFGQALSPLFGFARLAPVPLATQTWATLFGETSASMGHLLHYVAGLIAYPLGWHVARALLLRAAPASLPRPAVLGLGVLGYGVALWVFALWFMASVVNGLPPFLAFTGITWVALVGHVLFAAVYAAVAETRLPD